MGVTLHIEQLVLHGFDPRDRHAFGDALHSELASLFGRDASAMHEPRAIERVDGGTVNVAGHRSPGVARAVAGAIHRGVTK
jgi:hypothetical protein